jgi:hypothetical protein
MADVELTAGDLLAITDALVTGETAGVEHPAGLTPKELRTWVANRIVVPSAGGAGRGNHARFTATQATAVVYAARWARRLGLGGDGLKMVVATVESLGAAGLAELRPPAESRILPRFGAVGVVEVKPSPGGGNMPAQLCLARTHRAVAAAIRRMCRDGERNPTGRNRGSVMR